MIIIEAWFSIGVEGKITRPLLTELLVDQFDMRKEAVSGVFWMKMTNWIKYQHAYDGLGFN
jgi:hypothetical protein